MYALRRFISLCISFSFLTMSYTGVVLFLAPKGRIANWTNWELLGLDKTQYTNLHVTFMVLFLVGMLFHIYLNWRALFIYLTNKAREFSLFTKEFIFHLFTFLDRLNYIFPFNNSISKSTATPPSFTSIYYKLK